MLRVTAATGAGATRGQIRQTECRTPNINHEKLGGLVCLICTRHKPECEYFCCQGLQEDGTMKRILLASAAVMAMAGLIGAASAADLPRQQQMYKAPAYVAPVFNWTGFYVGVNGGG